MRSSTSLPLSLGQVLQEESVRLYGPGTTSLTTRWLLTAEEILDAKTLAQKLAGRLKADTPAAIAKWAVNSSHDVDYKNAIADEVNKILNDLAAARWLFEHPAFGDAKVPPYDGLGAASDCKDADAVFNLNRQMFDALFRDETRSAADSRYAEVVSEIHRRAADKENPRPRTALSISGGGIRSATFALGVMQALARRRILEQFDFVSTVSGGGYIGSWLSSWVRRDPWGIRGVSALLTRRAAERLEPEPTPLRHLRAYSNYLTPRLGALSADTWALVATYVRNLLLNWIVLIPLLAGVVALPRLVMTAVMHRARDIDFCGIHASSTQAAFAIGVVLLLIALFFLVWNRPVVDRAETETEDRSWKKKKTFTDGRFLKWCLVPFMASSFALLLAWAWHLADHPNEEDLPLRPFLYIGAGVCLAAFAWFAWQYSRASFAQSRVDPTRQQERKWMRVGWEAVASLAAGLVGGLLAWLLTIEFAGAVTKIASVGAIRWPIADTGGLTTPTTLYVCFGVPLILGILFLQCVVFVGAASHQNHDFDREWWARAAGWVLIGAVAWIALAVISIYGPVAIYHLPKVLSAAGGAAGVFSLIAGWSANTDAAKKKAGENKTSPLTNVALALAVPVFVLYILSLISTGTTWALQQPWALQKMKAYVPPDEAAIERDARLADRATHDYSTAVAAKSVKVKEVPVVNVPRHRSFEHFRVVQQADGRLVAAIVFGLPLLALLFSRAIGVNVFSMHAMYRNRLVRAYLGASRWNRHPNAFTGFDADDNMLMHELRPEYIWWYSFRDPEQARELLATAAAKTRLDFLNQEIAARVGDLGGDAKALTQALNALIATDDLLAKFDPTAAPASAEVRPLRNRRFIEKAFNDDIYPSPMPLICADDVIDAAGLLDRFQKRQDSAASALRELFKIKDPSDLTTLLGEINSVIETAVLAGNSAFNLNINTDPFNWSDADGIHRMIDNRLRLDVAFDRLLTPLQLARPLHIVNICLNLTTGAELGWQERKGESLTVSPMASGSHRLGYRDTRNYGEISLGTAVTISGAAASPNMGYHSSPALAFLMTLFNVRLGWWLGNPGLAGNDTFQRRNPRSSILPFLYEATGNSDDRYEYVYLSDGGHFENLGIYEMVLRRCHKIVISDAAADPKYIYDDLGNAIRKIRIDLGVQIVITDIGILPPADRDPKKPQRYAAVGKILYRDIDGDGAVDGDLLYIKPVVYDQGPRDVLNYAKNSPTFPHESTADQFFSESQFESYRALGAFAIDQICKNSDKDVKSVASLIDAAADKIKT
jgi:hypothetical protein